MKHLISLTLFIVILTSCETSKDKSENVVREYISAIQTQDWTKAKNLIFDMSASNDVTIFPSADEKDSSNDVDGTTDQEIFNMNTWRHFSIKEIDEIEVFEINDPTREKCEEIGISYLPVMPTNAPRGYCVKVRSGDKNVYFIVVRTEIDHQYKIYQTEGLYDYDLEGFKKKTGCDVELYSANGLRLTRCLRDLKSFYTFADAVELNDSTTQYLIFPSLKNHKTHFSKKPKAVKYKQSFGETAVFCDDTTSYLINDKNIIFDSYNVISLDDIMRDIVSFNESPLLREPDSHDLLKEEGDIAYYGRLIQQKTNLITEQQKREEEIRKENERKARAAKYKAQGVALLDSYFTNNGKGAKGVKYNALNTSNKTAKYIIIEVVGYNAVDDPVWSNGYIKRCRGIGPIGPGESGSWNFDDLWERGEIVDSYEIKNLIIQFNDGTSKRVNLPQELPSDWRDWLY